MKNFLIAMVLSLSLVGCASFDKNINTNKLLTQVAVMKVVEVGDTVESRKARAEKIAEVANEAHSWLEFKSLSVDELHAELIAKVNALDIEPSDKLLGTLLVDSVVAQLKERVVDGVKVPLVGEEAKYQINTVLDWVESTASMY